MAVNSIGAGTTQTSGALDLPPNITAVVQTVADDYFGLEMVKAGAPAAGHVANSAVQILGIVAVGVLLVYLLRS